MKQLGMQQEDANEEGKNAANEIGATGGSNTFNQQEEEFEIKSFMTCSVYCIKYQLWRKLQVPIQNQILTFKGAQLSNPVELRNAFGVETYGSEKMSLQKFMMRIQTQNPLNFEMGLQLSLPAGQENQYRQRMQTLKGEVNVNVAPSQHKRPQVPPINLGNSKQTRND